ncbi:transcriptional regulator PcaR [Rhodococcus rhodochrous]|uniref:IclR family transcriptional regulator n=1 Tax=Rhodococcus rhodochrous TaxID=1829 RepID=UPI0007507EAE|nr:IclR family transcriptional regulator [Rhodococcus rhodochrous]MDO1485124.1 IclR family transcriptional regulator [Rhodococcus rhodochrous]SNV09942.1 transcriptional regulator PcaR [Rhodococcus rhodochrous]
MTATENGQASGELNGETKSAPAIQAVDRAAVILSTFSAAKPRLTLNEITAALGTSKATAHRYTKALRAANLLRYDTAETVYSLGPQVLALAAAARAGLPVIRIAEPFMERLLQEVKETVVLSVWDGESPVVVASNDNTDVVARITVSVGARLSPTASAQGRVFCAFLPEAEVPMLRREIQTDPEFAEELDAIRESGVSVKSPVVNGIRTLAAPVFQGGQVVAALAVVAIAIPGEDVVERHIHELRRAAENLSAELGRA